MPARLPRARLQLEWVLFGFRQFALFIFYVNLKPVASYSTPHVHGNSLRRTVLSSRGVAVQFHTPYEGYPMEPQAEGETGRPHLLLRKDRVSQCNSGLTALWLLSVEATGSSGTNYNGSRDRTANGRTRLLQVQGRLKVFPRK
ncbi:hypothetical protein L210DRAFT_3512192 [Boletus edulis BED1]|uniref:Uncharacterized protein n=1 Tax=Boletus edulis BED1 TaxID=1328754 RepID=A0AAD4BBJ3_BOLED|nr:hypothetical protein L210DRAFT_3512192 [Boletus edulis BED1]